MQLGMGGFNVEGFRPRQILRPSPGALLLRLRPIRLALRAALSQKERVILSFKRAPSCEEVFYRMAAGFRANSGVLYQIIRGKPVVDTVRKNVKADGSFQRMFAVDQNVENQVHRGTHPITNQQGPGAGQDHGKENRHQLSGVQWKYKCSWAVCKVIPEETDRVRPAPLFLKNDVVEIVIHIDQKTTSKAAGSGFRRTGHIVGRCAERQ